MGGSLGMAAGEAVIKGLETAVDKGTPFIMFAASGGARMQEGILSLMQLPRTTVAVQMLREARQALHRRADQSDHRRRHRLLRACWATCISPSPARSSALPVRA